MFAQNKNAGKHLICDFKEIPSFDIDIKGICKELCALHNYVILGEVEHVFQPQGYTFLFLLSESHLSVHTFPEKKYLSFDLYTCREYADNSVYESIFEWLLSKFNSTGTFQIIDRSF
jgi:S-adenosylmethionine/arginine decarboxylase-like enzyme